MKYEVLKRFKPDSGLEPFEIGSEYETDNEQEAKALAKAGFLKMGEQSGEAGVVNMSESDELDGTVNEVKESITSNYSREELESLRNEEEEGQNRKGVISHIDSLIEEK